MRGIILNQSNLPSPIQVFPEENQDGSVTYYCATVDVYGEYGNPVSQSFATRAEAEAMRRELLGV